jgi:O-antigen/teichoic acid export membrane protein
LTIIAQGGAALAYAGFAAMQTRWLGATGRGDVTLVVTVAFFAVAVVDLGYTSAMPFQVGQQRPGSRTLPGNFVAWSCVSIPFVFGTLTLLAWGTDLFGLSAYVIRYGPAMLAMICASQIYNFFSFEALSWKDFRTYNALAAISQTVMPLALAGVFLLAPDRLSVEVVVGCYIVGYLAAAGASLHLSRSRLLLYLEGPRVSLEALRAHLRVGVRSFPSVLTGQLLVRLDVLLLYYFLRQPQDIGYYSVAILIAAMWNQVPSWIAATIWPKVAHDDPDHRTITHGLSGAAVYISAVAAAAWLALAPVLPHLLEEMFGSGFGVVYGLTVLLLPRLVLAPAGQLMAGNLAGKGYGVYHPLAAVVGLVAATALNVLLIPRFGVSGAALAMGLSYVLQFAVIVRGYCVMNHITVAELARESTTVFWGHLEQQLALARSRRFARGSEGRG